MTRFASKLSLSVVAVVLVAVVLVAGVVSSIAVAKTPAPSVLGTDWAGTEDFKGSIKGVGKIKTFGANTASIDEAGDFVYSTPNGFDIDGTLIQDDKKLLITLSGSGIDTLEDSIADIIATTLAGEGVDVGVLSIDIDPTEVNVKGKLKVNNDGVFMKFTLKSKFEGFSSTLGAGQGKFTVKGELLLLAV